MNDSIKLVKKDISVIFKINKMNFYVFIYPLCMSCLVFTSNLAISIQIIASSAAYAVYGIVVGLITAEEKTKSAVIFQSLPLSKKSIVSGKYIFAMVIILITSFVSSLFPIVKSIIDKDISVSILGFLNSFMFCLILFSIFFPFYYKMGYLKMNTINLIIFYSLIFIPIVINLLRDVAILKPVIYITSKMVNYVTQNLLTALIGCIIIYGLSMIISLNIESNK
nr:ABC-2 transporter permease [Sedimentibacter sp.]